MKTDRVPGLGSLSLLLALVSCVACRPSGEVATVVLGLGVVPEGVETIAFHVVDPERSLVVASATITPPALDVVLGVPAEIPLEFRAVARAGDAGPAALGGAMPAYFGAIARTIPLADEQTTVAFTLHPAGVLTMRAFLPLGSGYDEVLTVRLTPEEPDELPRLFTLAPLDPDAPRDTHSVVLRRGRWSAALVKDDPEDDGPVLRTGRGLWVARETESIASLLVVPEPRTIAATAPARLELELLAVDASPAAQGGVVETPVEGALALLLTAAARDGNGDEAAPLVPEAVAIETVAEPGTILVAPPRLSEGALSVPGTVATLSVAGSGRLRLRVAATLVDGRTIDGVLAVNVLAAGDAPSTPERVSLTIDDPDALREGARLSLELVDGRGLYASAGGTFDLSASDPWISFPGGTTVAIEPDARGVVSVPIVRASGPRGGDVVLRATFTSSDARVIESSITVPSLELER
jgi:hypothetical protein